MKFSGAVLTGGESRRMGRDKAFVDVGGKPLVQAAVDALQGAGASEVLAVGGDAAALQGLGLGVVIVPDRWPGEGPLGAITTALAAAAQPVVVVLACDLPDVTPDAVRAVLEGMEFGSDAAMPEIDGRREVLLAAYRRTCRALFEAALRVGVRAPKDALDGLDVAIVELADPRWARNVNTPADLADT